MPDWMPIHGAKARCSIDNILLPVFQRAPLYAPPPSPAKPRFAISKPDPASNLNFQTLPIASSIPPG